MSTEETVLTGISTALAGMSGWSSTRIVEGLPTAAEVRANTAYISPSGCTSVRGDGADLTGYKRTMTVDVLIAVPASGQSAGARIRAALAVSALARMAIEASPTIGGVVEDLQVAFAQVSGDELGIPGMGVAIGEVGVWWLSDGGQA